MSISDDLVCFEDELFDKSVPLGDSQGSGNAPMLVTYQGKKEIIEKGDLSLIREQSAVQEESILMSRHSSAISHSVEEQKHQDN